MLPTGLAAGSYTLEVRMTLVASMARESKNIQIGRLRRELTMVDG
jgi:hypothetical protein